MTAMMEVHFSGVVIAVITFLIIGLFHPIVVKTEYRWGTKPWWVFLIIGIAAIIAALLLENIILSSVLGILGASSLWSIKELFEQRTRVKKGWFPKNPNRENEYED